MVTTGFEEPAFSVPAPTAPLKEQSVVGETREANDLVGVKRLIATKSGNSLFVAR